MEQKPRYRLGVFESKPCYHCANGWLMLSGNAACSIDFWNRHTGCTEDYVHGFPKIYDPKKHHIKDKIDIKEIKTEKRPVATPAPNPKGEKHSPGKTNQARMF